jgi:hypothetical protein
MAPLSQNGNKPLDQALAGLGAAQSFAQRGPAPVHLWNPPFCGDIEMRIAADGTWYYLGSPIGRPALVKLFSSILRKDPDGYVLVTPVEKVGIKVDDAPFLAVEMRVEDGRIGFRTQVDDFVWVDAEHPLRFEKGVAEGVKPYVKIRGELWALLNRALFYDLVEIGATATHEGESWFGVTSGALFFPMCRAAEIEGL